MWSNKFSTEVVIGLALSFSFTYSQIYWLLRPSQIPSQPKMRNSSVDERVLLVISGTAIMSYSETVKSVFFLYSRSPIARERLRLPLILPSTI